MYGYFGVSKLTDGIVAFCKLVVRIWAYNFLLDLCCMLCSSAILFLDKTPNTHNIEKERFNLAYCFGLYSPSSRTEISWQQGMAEQR